jgi:hypothetical protein
VSETLYLYHISIGPKFWILHVFFIHCFLGLLLFILTYRLMRAYFRSAYIKENNIQRKQHVSWFPRLRTLLSSYRFPPDEHTHRGTIGKKRIAAYAATRPPSFPQDVRIRRNTYVRRNRIRICSRRRWARRCVTGHYCRQRLPRSRRVSSGAAGGGQFAIQFKEDSSRVAPSPSLPPPVSSTRPSRFPLTGVRARARARALYFVLVMAKLLP